MKNQATPSLDPATVALRLGLCAAALAGTAGAVGDANAAIVTFSTPIPIPQDVFGVYVNLLTGATATSSFAGWDFNPYLANAGTQLGFYWATTAGGVATAATGGSYIDLAPGTVVSSASTFSRTILGTTGTPFVTAGTHVLGIKFFNENTASTNYGYLTISNGAGAGFPATILGWSFENTGAAITVPSPVPEPATGLMLSAGALALGAVQLRRLRRQQRLRVH